MAHKQKSLTGQNNLDGAFLGAATMKMDSRKFLSALNDSAQAKVAFFESKVKELGNAAGKNWKLAGLKPSVLFIEDRDSHQYYHAVHRREAGGRVVIGNITPITIVEEQKKTLFESSCKGLIDAIELNDQTGMNAAYNKMAAQRFSGRVVPMSGSVVTKDGVTRRINVQAENSLDESVKPRLVSAIVESLKDRVIIENGTVVSGAFNDGSEVRLPVTKWASLKLIARRMREAARDAYLSEGFQNRISDVAGHIYNDDVKSAVDVMVPLIKESEEFTLLTRVDVKTLVENALAAKGIFNQQLCNDTATLMYRSNAKINRGTIVKEWKAIARKSQHPTLVENVQILEGAKNFEPALDRFLELMFEAISDREVTAGALATTLETLKQKTPKLRESHDLAGKMDDLINRLKDRNLDDSAIYEAEDFIATIQEELASGQNLANYDEMPGSKPAAPGMDAQPEEGAANKSGPTIVINSPLINFGTAAPAAGEEDMDLGDELGAETPDVGPEAKDELSDEELGSLLGGEQGQAAPAGGAPAGQAPAPSTGMGGINTSLEWLDQDADVISEKYAYSPKLKFTGGDYGTPAITDSEDLSNVVQAMREIAEQHDLNGDRLEENLDNLAKAGLKAVGLRVPESKWSKAVEQAITQFNEEWKKPWDVSDEDEEAESHDSKDEDDDSNEGEHDPVNPKIWDKDDEDGVAEDQYKWGTRMRRRNPRRSSLTPMESKEAVTWYQSEGDSKAGIFEGVRFVLDHGASTGLDPVIMSMDGSIEIPVPQMLHESARAAAGADDGDASAFVNWLSEGLEQLRPVSSEEEELIQEAMATIKAGPDGSISVDVEGDVEVSHGEEDVEDSDMTDEDSFEPMDHHGDVGDELGHEMGDEEESMKPVASVVPPTEGPAIRDHEGAMDFEGPEGMAEDKEITAPPKAEYTKYAAEKDKRNVKEAGLPDDGGNELEGIGPDYEEDDGTGTHSPVAK